MSDQDKFPSFKDHVKRVDSRSDHMSWSHPDCVEVDAERDDETRRRLERVRRRRRIDEKVIDTVEVGHYPHLKNLGETSFLNDHDDHSMSNAEKRSHYEHVIPSGREHIVRMETLQSYKDSSQQFNNFLRNPKSRHQGHILLPSHEDHWTGAKINQDSIRKRYAEADDLMSHRTGEDITSYRGVSSSSRIHSLAPGQVFTDHGYVGTSLKRSVAREFSGSHQEPGPWSQPANVDRRVPSELHNHSIIAKIHTPAGHMGHYLDVDDFNEHSGEREFALHRGTKFRIDRHEIDPDEKIHLIHMTVVGQHPRKLVTKEELSGESDRTTAWERWHEKKFGFKPTWHKGY